MVEKGFFKFFSAYLWAHAKSNQNQTERDLFTSRRINALIPYCLQILLKQRKPKEKTKQTKNSSCPHCPTRLRHRPPPAVTGGPGRAACPGAVPSRLLAGEEGLGLPADGVDAERAAQRQLPGADLVGLQVRAHQVCQSLQHRELHIRTAQTHLHTVTERLNTSH